MRNRNRTNENYGVFYCFILLVDLFPARPGPDWTGWAAHFYFDKRSVQWKSDRADTHTTHVFQFKFI